MLRQRKIVEVPQEWCRSLGEGVRVGLCDAAMEESHPVFSGIPVTVMSFVDTRESFETVHGTHMAGTIAKMCPKCTILFARATYRRSGTMKSLRLSLEWMEEQGVDVLSMSLAYPNDDKNISERLERMDSDGTIILAARTEPPKLYPYSYPFVVSVEKSRALDRDGGKIDLFGPGELYSAAPGGGYGSLAGSSVACSYAAGIAVLAKGYSKSVNRAEFISSLRTRPSSR